MKTYIIHCVDGSVIPCKSQVDIRSLKIASIYAGKDARKIEQCSLKEYITLLKMKERKNGY